MANVARSFPPNQSCAIALVDIVDVNVYWCSRRDTEGIRKRRSALAEEVAEQIARSARSGVT
jgi:hypothetical protein